MSSAASKRILAEVKRIIPPLSEKLHKGQAGRVGVIGGSQDYSGAPFFASISALRLGCDLSHVICEPEAGHVIKTYSPDLIVHPILKAFPKNESSKEHFNETVHKLTGILSRLHVIVVGPGLGRDDHMQDFARAAISIARSQDKYIVIDADGLWLVQNEPGCIKGYAKAVLTPNVVEFDRLLQALKIDKDEGPREELASRLSAALGNVVILQKGAKDLISNGKDTETVDEPGGLKRVGGQGDILSGTVATFLAWGKSYVEGGLDGGDVQDRIDTNRIPLLAAYGGSTITRKTSRLANAKHGRGVLTSDMLMEIGSAYQELFGEQGEKGFKGNL